MVTHTEARTFEISKLINVLKNPETFLRSLEIVAVSNLARWIIDKNDHVYKTKMKETIHMLILQHQILKAQKSLNHDEYCYHIKQFILTSANSYYAHVLYFRLETSTLYFPCLSFFFIDRT